MIYFKSEKGNLKSFFYKWLSRNNKQKSFAIPTFILHGGFMQNISLFVVHNKIIFVNLDKNIRRVSYWNPGGLCDGQSLHGSLDRQSYNNGIDDTFNCFLKYFLWREFSLPPVGSMSRFKFGFSC
jgi:hypothetical protein